MDHSMEFWIYDKNLNKIGYLDEYVSAIWTRRFQTYGDCELYTLATPELMELLKEDNYILKTQQSDEHKMLCLIEKVTLTTDEEGTDYLTVEGYDVLKVLSFRIIEGRASLFGEVENYIRSLIETNATSPTNALRKISLLELDDYKGLSSAKYSLGSSYENLLEHIQDVITYYGYGIEAVFNEDTKKVRIGLYKPEVKKVTFSPDYDNVISSNYILDKTEYKNMAVVLGELDATNTQVIEKIGDDLSELDRREVVLDDTGITHEVDLPLEYQGVEYLESTGTQFIATNYIPVILNYPNEYPLATIEFQTVAISSAESYNFIFGMYKTSSIKMRCGYNTSGVFWDDGSCKYSSDTVTSSNVTARCWPNSMPQGTRESDSIAVDIFAQNNTYRGAHKAGTKRVYNIIIRKGNPTQSDPDKGNYENFDNGDVIAHFVPCYRVSDKKPGMFESITKVFYTNSGTGEFNLGPETDRKMFINDKQYRQMIIQNGKDMLAENAILKTFDGEVEDSSFEFEKDYYLGDSLLIRNEYGIEGQAMVTEMIDSDSDQNGHTMTPTFEFLEYTEPTELPQEYQQVEYVQSTGVQFILLNNYEFIPDDTTGVEMIFSPSNADDLYWFGASETSNLDTAMAIGSATTLYSRWNTLDAVSSRIACESFTTYVYRLNYMNDRHRMAKVFGSDEEHYSDNINSVLYRSGSRTIKLGVFGGNVAGTPNYLKTGKLYGLKITRGQTIIGNFIPCYRIEDGVAGLYDLCGTLNDDTGTPFYPNVFGEPDFIVGPNVNRYSNNNPYVPPTPPGPVTENAILLQNGSPMLTQLGSPMTIESPTSSEGTKISQLPAASTINNADLIPIVQSNTTKKITYEQFADCVEDYILERGVSGIWNYEKWSDGTYKCWTRQSFSVSFGVWGNVFESKSSLKYSYPITFVSVQNTQYSIETSGRECWASSWMAGTTSVTPEVMINSASSPNASGYINFYTVGKWK